MLAAYDIPMTAQELSVELGVAMPYLEEELAILVKAGVLLKTGEKYRTNLVILTGDYEQDFDRRTPLPMRSMRMRRSFFHRCESFRLRETIPTTIAFYGCY